MTLEERAKAYKEEVHKKYLEAEENGYMPSLWANVDNIWLDGYKEALKAKVNTTIISDAPPMNDDVIPLNEIGKIGTVKVYNQAFVDKQQKRIEELTEQNTSLLTSVENLNKSVQKLEKKLEQTEKELADYQFNYPSIKELSKESAELKAQIEKMKEVISELIAITDKDICKDCDGGIHCSECYVEHAQTYASHFINEKEVKENDKRK